MREIKFRGKRIDNNKWIYGSLIIEPNLPKFSSIYSDINNKGKSQYLIYPIDARDGRAVEVIPESVGQYIGLKDKNGKEIYEGNILGDVGCEETEIHGIVKWMDDRGTYYLVGEDGYVTDSDYCYDGLDWNKLEIIGEIHENPELLKETK